MISAIFLEKNFKDGLTDKKQGKKQPQQNITESRW